MIHSYIGISLTLGRNPETQTNLHGSGAAKLCDRPDDMSSSTMNLID